jgi:hypothetical protein
MIQLAIKHAPKEGFGFNAIIRKKRRCSADNDQLN